MTYSSLESEYLIELIKCAIKTEPMPAPPNSLNWERIIDMSAKQQVYSIIAQGFDKSLVPKECAQSLDLYSQTELVRTVAMKNELELIEAELTKKQIRYMLLKGSVLREYYPQQRMRQMSDIDILYDVAKRDELFKIMKSRGFRLTTTCENSDDFFKEPFYTFEWHRELFFKEASFCPVFDLWKNAVPDSENPYKYHINETDHFVYTICHMYKHYATNGCGVRFLCDIYLLMKKSAMNFDSAMKRLEEIGISAFANDAILLSIAIFDGKDITDNQQKMLDFMLSNGVYGNRVVDYEKLLDEFKRSKFRYLFSRIFPPMKKMKADYRALERKPYLLPVYYIIRLFVKVRYNLRPAIAELKEIKKLK